MPDDVAVMGVENEETLCEMSSPSVDEPAFGRGAGGLRSDADVRPIDARTEGSTEADLGGATGKSREEIARHRCDRRLAGGAGHSIDSPVSQFRAAGDRCVKGTSAVAQHVETYLSRGARTIAQRREQSRTAGECEAIAR